MFSTRIASAITLLIASSGLVSASAQMPVVDLGYTLQIANEFNATGRYYSFNNIRYAKAPIGKLRFVAPVPPDVNRTVQDGSDINPTCPSASPNWLSVAYPFIGAYLGGQKTFNASSYTIPPPSPPSFPPNVGTPEDCLGLDVVVPKQIFDLAKNGTNTTNVGAPGKSRHQDWKLLLSEQHTCGSEISPRNVLSCIICAIMTVLTLVM